LKGAQGARNYSQCDSLLMSDQCGAHTFPYLEVKNSTAQVEHEASTSKIGEDQIFYFRQRGISTEEAVGMIVNGFCKEVFRELPMEFGVDAKKILGMRHEGCGGKNMNATTRSGNGYRLSDHQNSSGNQCWRTRTCTFKPRESKSFGGSTSLSKRA